MPAPVRPAHALAALLLAAAPFARAQPAPAPPAATAPADRCQALIRRAPTAPATGSPTAAGSPAAEALPDGGCRFTGVRLGSDRFGYQAATVTEHGIPPDLLAGGPRVPRTAVDAQIEARDITFSLHSGNPRVDWLNRQQQIPFDATLDVAYDPAHGDIHLRTLALNGPGIGTVSLAMEASGLSDASFPGRVQLRSLNLHLDSRRVLATFTVAPLSNMLPENDPEGAFQALKAQTVAGLRALLPLAHASADTTAALVAFATDFPHPQHVLDLSVTATPSVTLDEVTESAGNSARIPALLGKLTITATYAGDPH